MTTLHMMALLVGTLLLGACGLNVLQTPPFTQAEAEAFIGAPFPASATDLVWQVEGFTDTLVAAQYSAPAADAETHVRALGLWPLTSDANTPGSLTARRDDFPANRFYHVRVAVSADGATWQVALRVHSM